jgi:hypothetical protein
MKTLFLIIAATVALALSAVAQNVDCSLLTFVPNPDLPFDMVELENSGSQAARALFCLKQDWTDEKPPEPGVVKVGVYQRPDVALGGSKWLFCGWLWMKTKEVNALHKRPSL